MQKLLFSTLAVPLLVGSATAGTLDLNLGLQATTTAWPDDHGGGTSLDIGWWFRDWIGASFIEKEQYAQVDERIMSYFSANVAGRHVFGPIRTTATLGLVHEHEEPRSAFTEQPLSSFFGVGDGIRHRMAGRAGVTLALPFTDHAHGDWYVAVDIDATKFMDTDRGPSWMTSAGLKVGFTYDFSAGVKTR